MRRPLLDLTELRSSIARDVRVAGRSLRRTPLVTSVAVLSIALGMIATTSMFSIVDAALFRPPPLPGADRLAMLFMTSASGGESPELTRWSWPRTRLLRERVTSFDDIASFSSSVLALTGDEPEPVTAEMISASYWSTLLVEPVIGRRFTPDEDEGAGAHPVVIVAHDLWQRRYGGDPALIGRTIGVNGVSLTVVGVAPLGFSGLSGRSQLWIPASMAPSVSYGDYLHTNQNFISVVGRLRAGVSLAQARNELAVVGAFIQRELPSRGGRVQGDTTRYAATAISLIDARIDPSTRRPMLLLLAAVGCLLALACANVAGLLLGRAVARRREIAIRVATGASRARVMRPLLIESAMIALAGGAVAALVSVPIAPRLALPAALSRGRNFYGALGEFATPHVDARTLAAAFLLCAMATFAFGLLPALRASRVDLTRDLKDGAGASSGGGHVDSRQVIVGVEVALAMVLLLCGAALSATWRRTVSADVGFDHSHLLTFWLRPSEVRYTPAKAPALLEGVLAAIARVPGVEAATVDGCAPLGGCANSTLYIAGRDTAPGGAPPVLRHYIAPDHFRTLRVAIVRGRAFDARDRAGAPHVAIINEGAAHRFWSGQDPIGQRVWFGGGSSFDRPDSSAEIVGIVRDVAYQPLDEHPVQADFYTPYAQFTYASRMVMVRTRGDPSSMVPALRNAVRIADPNLALFDVRTMEDRMRDSWARLSYQMRLFGAFAAAAMLLAASGIFAVIVHAVGSRRRELGIRAALGASPARIMSVVATRGARPAVIGGAIGIIVALSLGRVLRASLYGAVIPDPVVVAIVLLVAALVTLLSTALAARRALAIAPAEALRHH